MWRDYWIKATTREAFEAALSTCTTDGLSVDVIGDLSKAAEYDKDGNEIFPACTVSGWHANVRCLGELPESLAVYSIPEPQQKKRVWL